MTTEFKLGYIAAKNDYPEFTLDGKTREFINGFTQYMRDQDNLAGNPDTDTFDY